MIYCDTSYIAKCYLNERGSDAVRTLFAADPGVACLELGRIELAACLHRHLREGRISNAAYGIVLRQFAADEEDEVWRWIPISTAILQRSVDVYATLPKHCFLRSSDALHLAGAALAGFDQVHTHDRNMLAAAECFGLQGVDIIP